jgi:hypothetical protein
MRQFLVPALACLGILGSWLAPSAKASESDQRMILTINEPVQLAGTLLDPGQYVARLVESAANRHIVQVFNSDGALVTTVLATPDYRLEATGQPQINFYESSAGQPSAIRSWFFPGNQTGQHFAEPSARP